MPRHPIGYLHPTESTFSILHRDHIHLLIYLSFLHLSMQQSGPVEIRTPALPIKSRTHNLAVLRVQVQSLRTITKNKIVWSKAPQKPRRTISQNFTPSDFIPHYRSLRLWRMYIRPLWRFRWLYSATCYSAIRERLRGILNLRPRQDLNPRRRRDRPS